ncbi:MAG: UDP-N-acetylmuramate dehydrogenase [Deltaproteobacteria bacterium]|jgi:UDP-N-acetylmuramate dehydrogenase
MDERQRRHLEEIAGKGIAYDCLMTRYTTFRIGGKAEVLCPVETVDQLRVVMSFLDQEGIPCLVVGRGSNLLVKDGGIEGVVLVLRGRLATIKKDPKGESILRAGGGLSLTELLHFCQARGLGGLEFLAGIPGTVGGAVAMNAGARGQDMGDRVAGVELVMLHGDVETMTREDLHFSYRQSSIPRGAVIVQVELALEKEDPRAVAAKVASCLKERQETQPLGYPSAGSIFKNPPNGYAGGLIEKAGLKGERIGGAMISPKHANWIVNTGGAKAEDVLALMNLARQKVREQTGIILDPEIKVVGKSL